MIINENFAKLGKSNGSQLNLFKSNNENIINKKNKEKISINKNKIIKNIQSNKSLKNINLFF